MLRNLWKSAARSSSQRRRFRELSRDSTLCRTAGRKNSNSRLQPARRRVVRPWVKTTKLLPDMLGVGVRLHQPIDLRRAAWPDLDHPARPIRIGVDQSRLLVEAFVDRHDLASDRREQLRHRFHGFDRAEHVVLAEFRSDFRQLDVNDVAELALRVVGDADLRGAILTLADVLVLFGVLEIVRDVRHLCSAEDTCRTAGAKSIGGLKQSQETLAAVLKGVFVSSPAALR